MAGRSGWGSIYRRERPGGGYFPGYYLRYRKADGSRTQVYAGKTRSAAEREAARIRDEVERRATLPTEQRQGLSLAEFLEQYKSVLQMNVSPTTYRTHLGNLVSAAAFFKGKPLDEIRRADVESWLAHLKQSNQVKPLTLRRHKSTLSVCLETALGRGLLEQNPCKGIRLPRGQEIAIPYLSTEDLAKIYAHCPKEVRSFIVVLGETGLRLGEALSLTWQDIDSEMSRLTVRHSKSKRTRIVPLTPLAKEALHQMRERRGPVPLRGLSPIFGDGFDDSWVRRLFHKAVRDAGFGRLRLHDLRHAFASSLVRAGVPVPTVAELLGHSTPVLTLTRYGKHAPSDAGEQAIAALARFRGESPAPESGAVRQARQGR